MRSRVPELMAERQLSADELSRASGGRISIASAYRLKRGDWVMSKHIVAALVDVLKLEDIGPLFARD